MKSSLVTLFVFVGIIIRSNVTLAQSAVHVDTIKVVSKTANSALSKSASSVVLSIPSNTIKGLQNKLQALDPAKNATRLKATAINSFNQATNNWGDRLKLPKQKSIAFNITLENDTRYQPPEPVASINSPTVFTINTTTMPRTA